MAPLFPRVVAGVSLLLCLGATPGCVSARADGPHAPEDAGVESATPAPAPAPVSRTRLECGPTEMECCGACISESEGRCPENIHCPTTREAAPTR